MDAREGAAAMGGNSSQPWRCASEVGRAGERGSAVSGWSEVLNSEPTARSTKKRNSSPTLLYRQATLECRSRSELRGRRFYPGTLSSWSGTDVIIRKKHRGRSLEYVILKITLRRILRINLRGLGPGSRQETEWSGRRHTSLWTNPCRSVPVRFSVRETCLSGLPLKLRGSRTFQEWPSNVRLTDKVRTASQAARRAATADTQDTVQKIPQGNYQNHTRCYGALSRSVADAPPLSPSKLSVTIRCNGIAVLTVSRMAAAIAHDARLLLSLHVAVDARHQHTSVMKTARELFGISGDLTERDASLASAKPFAALFSLETARGDAPAKLARPTLPNVPPSDSVFHPANQPLDPLQRGLLLRVHHLTRSSHPLDAAELLPKTQKEASAYIKLRIKQHFARM
jgi:hypothetical protein